ncbi:MAG: VOC family protein [Lewinellaceae bacterium]|nr:VOC family protein [Lewinellaceae bacterium]
MAKVTGIGGIFLRCADTETMKAWYAQHLGIAIESWGAQLNWSEDAHPEAFSLLSFFNQGSDYFSPSKSGFMINFRVDDMDALLQQLKDAGVPLIGEPTDDAYGKFAWVMDPEGNKIELWEQPKN